MTGYIRFSLIFLKPNAGIPQVIFKQISEKITRPTVLTETDQFVIKLAETKAEVEKAQKLRYEVFNLEQGKGLQSANDAGIDSDEYDEYCLHLLAIDKSSHKTVGTYRIHLGSVAIASKGFYSEREYEISGLDKIADRCMELGRSCVSKEYRQGSVVSLLWGGIAELLIRGDLNLMLGCVSLEDKNPAEAWALQRLFKKEGRLSDILHAKARHPYILPPAPEEEIAKLLSHERTLKSHIPPLFKGYLRLGCKICGEPAFDHEFGTVDFLILVDKDKIPLRYVRHFNSVLEGL